MPHDLFTENRLCLFGLEQPFPETNQPNVPLNNTHALPPNGSVLASNAAKKHLEEQEESEKKMEVSHLQEIAYSIEHTDQPAPLEQFAGPNGQGLVNLLQAQGFTSIQRPQEFDPLDNNYFYATAPNGVRLWIILGFDTATRTQPEIRVRYGSTQLGTFNSLQALQKAMPALAQAAEKSLPPLEQFAGPTGQSLVKLLQAQGFTNIQQPQEFDPHDNNYFYATAPNGVRLWIILGFNTTTHTQPEIRVRQGTSVLGTYTSLGALQKYLATLH